MDESVSPGRFLASREGGTENPGELLGKREGGVGRGVVEVLPVVDEDVTEDAEDAEEDLDAICGQRVALVSSWSQELPREGRDSRLPSWLASWVGSSCPRPAPGPSVHLPHRRAALRHQGQACER